MKKISFSVASVLALAGSALGQDSVPVTPGGNDALSAYDNSSQRVRYVVDGVAQTTSWGHVIFVAPILKASRDADPLYKTQILGSSAVSPSLSRNVTFASRNYLLWTAPGQGVHPTANAPAAGSVPMTGFDYQFAIGSSDFSLNPSNVTGAIVGRDSTNLNRFFVERVCAAHSRANAGLPDTSTLALGSVDSLGNVVFRADNFNTLNTTSGRLLGDNIIRVNMATRNGILNLISSSGGNNTATDTGATTYIISNEATPTNVPASVLQPGVGPFGLVFDFANRLRTGSTTANTTNLAAAHLASGAAAHRGNPSFAPVTPLGGTAGTIACLAVPVSGSRVNTLDAAGLNFGTAGAPPTVAAGTPRSFTLPSPISTNLGFTTNLSGQASFRQYLSQVSFRGGTGLVGVGQNAAGQLVLAATASDPTNGDFIAVVTATGPTTSSWTIAAYPGQSVLTGANGAVIGTLNSPAVLSAPAVDRLGNVYFVGAWTPTSGPSATGLFKAVETGGGLRLELLLTTGQTITGANSTRPYTITALSLTDSDSLASGAFHNQHIIYDQAATGATPNPQAINAFGGAIVNAVITYNNAGTSEAYDTVLLVTPEPNLPCPADFNLSGSVSVQDIFDFLATYFSGSIAADFNQSGGVSVQDIFDFLAAYFAPCP
jgi:hypothetical protein